MVRPPWSRPGATCRTRGRGARRDEDPVCVPRALGAALAEEALGRAAKLLTCLAPELRPRFLRAIRRPPPSFRLCIVDHLDRFDACSREFHRQLGPRHLAVVISSTATRRTPPCFQDTTLAYMSLAGLLGVEEGGIARVMRTLDVMRSAASSAPSCTKGIDIGPSSPQCTERARERGGERLPHIAPCPSCVPHERRPFA